MTKTDLALLICSFIGYLITFYSFYHNLKREHLEREEREAKARRQEREERRREQEKDALWKQSVNDQLDRLTKRVDSHNRYAEMFREYGEDIAFIRGKLE